MRHLIKILHNQIAYEILHFHYVANEGQVIFSLYLLTKQYRELCISESSKKSLKCD